MIKPQKSQRQQPQQVHGFDLQFLPIKELCPVCSSRQAGHVFMTKSQNTLGIAQTVSRLMKELETILKSLLAYHLSGAFLLVPSWLN